MRTNTDLPYSFIFCLWLVTSFSIVQKRFLAKFLELWEHFKFFFTYILMDSEIQGVTNGTWHPGRNISLRINPYLQTLPNFIGQPFILDPYLLQFHKDQIVFFLWIISVTKVQFYKTKFLFTSETLLNFLVIPLCFVFSLRMQNVTRKYIHSWG